MTAVFQGLGFFAAWMTGITFYDALLNDSSIWWCLIPGFCFLLAMAGMEQQVEKRTSDKLKKEQADAAKTHW